ncbi:MAG: protein TolR [Nitrospirae bacterium]|nr:MAG: protein TolR [Nitrospirota bacterium]
MIFESRHRRFLSEINIIPLVDVVLVLLVIFMVTAPMLHRGLDLTLPRSATNTITPEERLVITIEPDQRVYLGKDPVTMVTLRTRLREAKLQNPLISVYLRSDRSVPYGRIIQVMDVVKGVGIERLGMVTNPKTGRNVDEEVVSTSSS